MIDALQVIKRSSFYRELHAQLQSPFPADAWHDEQMAFVVFDLKPGEQNLSGQNTRLVLFSVNLNKRALSRVQLLTVTDDMKEVMIADLSTAEQIVSALPPDW